MATLNIVRTLRRPADGAARLSDGHAGNLLPVGGVRELRAATEALNEASTGIALGGWSMRHEAFHDTLTGLLNRRGLRNRIDELLDGPGGARNLLVCLLARNRRMDG